MSEIKVSVIVPVYRAGEFFKDLLNKLVKQTLKEIEIILVDDKGGDDSFDIARKMAALDSRVILIENPENKGAGFSRNRGIERASGEYLAFVDADDDIPENYLEHLYTIATKSNKKVVKCKLRRALADGSYVYSQVMDRMKIQIQRGDHKTLLPIYTCEHTTGIYKRSWVKKQKATYAENARRGQDTCFLMNLMYNTPIKDLEMVEDICYTYRQYEQSYEIKKADLAYLEHMQVAGLFKIDFLLSKAPHQDITAYLQLTFEQRLGQMLTKALNDGVTLEEATPYLTVFAEKLKQWKSSKHEYAPLPYTEIFDLSQSDYSQFLEHRLAFANIKQRVNKLDSFLKDQRKTIRSHSLLLCRSLILRKYWNLKFKKSLTFGKKKQQLLKEYEKIKTLKRKSDAQLLSLQKELL